VSLTWDYTLKNLQPGASSVANNDWIHNEILRLSSALYKLWDAGNLPNAEYDAYMGMIKTENESALLFNLAFVSLLVIALESEIKY
jgi:hypothetical protein